MNASLRLIRVVPWLVVVAALGGAGCHKTATCRPGTLLVTLTCDERTPAGAKTVLLTLKEGTFAAPVESIPLTCPETNHQVTIGGYAAGRTLRASVVLVVGDGPARTVADQAVNLQDSCTVLPVKVSGPGAGDGGSDTDVAADSLASPDGGTDGAVGGDADDAPADLISDDAEAGGTMPVDVGIDIVVTPVPDGGLFTNGAACVADGECASSKCAGGVCCEERCDGKCQVCAAGTGKCSNLPEGATSVRCAAQPNAATCGETGACDAKGGCALFSPTTMCSAARCDGSGLSRIAAAFCDGLGHCLAGQTADCGAYRCSTGACGQTCTVGGDCNGVACVDGHCGGKRGVGAACDNNGQCDKGFCVDGVCCESDCSGGCMACAESLTTRPSGSCAPATAGTDPRGKCDPEAATCGNDGTCDGRGACRKRGVETTCQAATCDGNHTFSKAATCNSKGACDVPVTTDCGLYRCTSAGCREKPCTGDGDCASGSAFCEPTTQQCQPKKALGGVCVHDEDCDGGPCVKGICCESACTGTCLSCSAADTGGAMGRCLPVVLGKADPAGGCTVEPESSCGKTGVCDGKGACQMQGATVECKAESCSGSTYTPSSKCDGAGRCVTPGTKDCGAYRCEGDVQCKTGCVADNDCAARSICSNGRCLRAACNSADWCWHNPRPFGYAVADIWGTSSTNIWALSYGGALAHFDGTVWEGTVNPTTAGMSALNGADGIVWAVGDTGTILKWEGRDWRKITSGVTTELRDVWALRSNDAWAVGPSVALHWNGTSWTKSAAFTGFGFAVSGRATNDVWVAGETFVYHWDGANWSTEDLTSMLPDDSHFDDLAVEPSGDVWVVSHNEDSGNENYILHRSNGSWTILHSSALYDRVSRDDDGRLWFASDTGHTATWKPSAGEPAPTEIPALMGMDTIAVQPVGAGQAFLAVSTAPTSGSVWRWDGASATNTFSGFTDDLSAILASPVSDRVDVASVYGKIWQLSGFSWTPQTLPASVHLSSLGSLGYPGAYAPLAGGTGPTLLSGGIGWRTLTTGPSFADQVTAITNTSAPSPETAITWAVGSKGKIWSIDWRANVDASLSTGTTENLLDVATVGTSEIWVVGEHGTILRRVGSGAFTPVPANGVASHINTVCANSSTDIWIAATGGPTVLHGNGTTWTAAAQGLAIGLKKLHCLGSELLGLDENGYGSWTYANGQWSVDVTGAVGQSMSVNGTKIWIAGRGGAILWHPR